MKNRVVIVTGGGSGIGRAAAILFAHAGAWVVVVGRRGTPLEETAKASNRIIPVQADLIREDELKRVIQIIDKRWSRIDVLVNNAGAFVQRTLQEIDQQVMTSLFATNVLAPSLLSRAALPFLKSSQGSIVNISSTFGHKAAPMISHYAASKAAVEHLTRCWALELALDKVRVNAVAPGPTETDILSTSGLSPATIEQIKKDEIERVPLGRRGTADEIAAWIVSLANPDASWITGQIIAVDGGLGIA